MKRTIVLWVAMFIFLAGLTGCASSDENITWAQNLKTDDIEKMEAVRMPGGENERYKNYDPSEFPRIVEIINNAKGEKLDNPESIAGGGITFYVTLLDGTRYSFANNGNRYLVINGVSYDADYDWLDEWGNEKLNSKVPDNFVY